MSYVFAIGTKSRPQAHDNNRHDNSFDPGGMIPGYSIIEPDGPGCITRCGFLRYEDEYTIAAAAIGMLEANARAPSWRGKRERRSGGRESAPGATRSRTGLEAD